MKYLKTSKGILFFFFLAVALALYGRSLSYDFVYDDHWRILKNPAIKTLAHPLRFFTDNETQSAKLGLNVHTFRPLFTLNLALDYALWEKRPWGYRFLNIVFHSLNATLVALLAMCLLNVSLWGGLLSGLLFLVHPVQVESVVWIVERSNIMALLFILLALHSWIKFQSDQNHSCLLVAYLLVFTGLLYRENVVAFLPMVFLIDFFMVYKGRGPWGFRWRQYGVLFLILLLYFVLRHESLGQTKQHAYWGGSFLTNALNVLAVWPRYLKGVIYPSSLSVNYDTTVVGSLLDGRAFFGAAVFAVYGGVIFVAWKRAWRWSLCLLLFLIFWAPSSGLVPLVTFFADRFFYPLMVFAGWSLGLLADASRSWVKNKSYPIQWGARGFLILGFFTLMATTHSHLPVWKNDLTLWQHATQVDPKDSFSWFCLALAQEEKASTLPLSEKEEWLSQAENSYRNALPGRLLKSYVGQVLVHLARVCWRQNKISLARHYAEQGLSLRPDLENEWRLIMSEAVQK